MEKFEVNHRKGISILKIKGDIEGENGAQLLDVIQNAAKSSKPFWIIDMPETNFIDSACLETFLRILTLIKKEHGKIVFTEVQPEVKEIFIITKLFDQFMFCDTVDMALDQVCIQNSGEDDELR